MTLVQKNISGKEYYTDDKVYYGFHLVKSATDTLWNFACVELGITKQTGFTSQETKDITDLAGIGSLHPTRFLLLKNGNAIPITYLANGSSDLHPNDIILRPTVDPVASSVPKPIATALRPSVSTKSVADRLKEIEDLHNMQFLTEPEYREKRAKIIAAL